MTERFPSPSSFGAPERYAEWRNGQDSAFKRLLTSKRKHSVLALPTGVGKSLVGVTYGTFAYGEGRTVVLTSTKGLQDQYLRDYADLGIVDVRGMSNYPCLALDDGKACDDGPCLEGKSCWKRDRGCMYFDAVARARQSKLVVTNYAFWMTQRRHAESGGGLGKVDLLVCDEAHELPAEVTGFLRVDVPLSIGELDVRLPRQASELGLPEWRAWAAVEAQRIRTILPNFPSGPRLKRVRELALGLERLAGSTGVWAHEPSAKGGWAFEPLWPNKHAAAWLWDGVGRCVFASATIRPFVMSRLGLSPCDYDWIECPSPFPISRRPIIHVPTTRVNHRTDPSNLGLLVARADQIIAGRLDRKGIIHTVSYDRAKFIAGRSEYRGIMFVHDPSNTRAVVEAFKATPAPAVLVSPSVHTGWDFPYEDARYQIVVKVPFPDTRAGITFARQQDDADFGAQHALTQLVQAAGRGMRAPDDCCETFVLDDNIRWVLHRYRELCPRWFLDAYRSSQLIPAPPKLADIDIDLPHLAA